MDIARVIGKIVATNKNERLDGSIICIIQPLDHKLEPSSRSPLVAIDATAMRGEGDLVYFCESADAGFCNLSGDKPLPTDAAIVGIVDHLDIQPQAVTDLS